jgi:hypothetical protein
MSLRRITLAACCSVAVVALAACGDNDSGESTDTSAAASTAAPTSSSGGGSQALPPVMVPTDGLDGSTVQVPLSNTLVIQAAEPTAWTGTVADAGIAEFVPGSDDGSAVFNPGVRPKAVGSTQVTITDGTTTITFTVEVTA